MERERGLTRFAHRAIHLPNMDIQLLNHGSFQQ